MKKLMQRGFGAVEMVLIIVIVGLIGGLGYYIYQNGKKTPENDESTTQTQTESTPEQTATKDYENSELGIKLTYPESWGEATLRDGELVSPGQGGYKQLVFSKHAELDINFVQKGFISPLDGCPEPLYAEKHDLSAKRASVIGWSGDDIRLYYQDWESLPETKYKVQTQNSTSENGWEKMSTDGEVLEYKDKYKYNHAVEPDGCTQASQAEVDEANAYRKYIRYALNFSNGTVVGVNAQYDARQNDNPSVRKELVKVLTSIKNK